MGDVQYRGGYHDARGDIMSTVGVFSTVGGYHEYRGGYLEYCGDVQYCGDIMMHVGGYHEYCGGCSVSWGKKSFVI